jgi:translation initiation factor IF-2
VEEGFECGILLDGFNDVKEGDILEAYETFGNAAKQRALKVILQRP